MGIRTPLVRAALVAMLLCGAVLALSACGTGFDAQTNRVYTAGVGSNHRGDTVDILNALFVENADETATLSAGLLALEPGGDAVTGVEVTTQDGQSIESSLDEPISLAFDELHLTGEEAEVVVRGANFLAGDFVQVELAFETSAPISIDVPVVARDDAYDEVAPAPNPGTTPAEEPSVAPS